MNGEYVTLMASLPALGPMLAAKHSPINRDRLTGRLRMLRPEHQAEIAVAAELLDWSRIALREDDAELVRKAHRIVPAMSSVPLAELVRGRMEMRTLVSALRRRHAGEDAPPVDALWGYGRYVTRIRTNWGQPGFGVTAAFPWVLQARDRLAKGDATGLERILLEEAWRMSSWCAVGHDFDFEAVALYIVRWNLLDRWTRYDAQTAAARFAELVDEALAAAPETLTETLT
ncbi:hypothetical protein [Qingshengfaniella alkalisoli]|uniref:DUF2764 family protein n=1 Tax=Qingshengfaniella alkalisoli TaxID=2599296 RepID=A0A5B8JA68_9RHOB|nr:hypothetical protein [Qingshengfaniella alkalisoli]QDY71197.1 hypothetical protein FPZ52_15980 [Qingshengfaniella alkalisoli]